MFTYLTITLTNGILSKSLLRSFITRIIHSNVNFRHTDGDCVKTKLDNDGKMVWLRHSCSDTSGKGVICAKRNIWETVEGCYAQPPEEAESGTYSLIDEFNLKRDPIKFCRDSCKATSRFFDIQNNVTAHYCHCIENAFPTGGFLPDPECEVPVCEDSQDPAQVNCYVEDGYRRTHLYRTWQTSCPPIDPDFKHKFIYVWQHHGSWHWGSKATLRCIPGYELPSSLPDGEYDITFRTQNVTCQFDDNGGRWSNIVPCQPVRCKSPPPAQPFGGSLTVINSLDPETNQQAETVLTYACANQNWAFSYPTDESLPSYFFTKNVNNITMSCNYSGYWEYDYGIEDSTCVGKQPDGTCETIVIPDCEDRSVLCQPLPNPGNSSKEILKQPNAENEVEYGTEIKFTCSNYKHYFDYSIPDDLTSFFYANNINETTLRCNEFKYWTVENGINGETCANKNSNNNELHCEYVQIPQCVDRAILCSDPPMPARAKIDFIKRPDLERYEHKTEIHYKCPDRNHYFDYSVGNDFISYAYTENIKAINVTCNQNGIWEVQGGYPGQTCSESEGFLSDQFSCRDLYIPDCEDRTVYCTFPPESIHGGDLSILNNPSPYFQKSDQCRWTKWFNSGKGSKGDQELIAELLKIYSWQVCPDPKDIKVRQVDNKELVTPNGPQRYSKFDTSTGFICKDSEQLQGVCEDYEVQLCCPYGPENGTEIILTCELPNWYLNYTDTPFVTEMTATCTDNSTWTSEVNSVTFCDDGTNECVLPRLPNCQDRTILCLDELPLPEDMIQTNVTSNLTLHGYSLNASYEYSCKNDELVLNMPTYPEAVVVRCTEPLGYPVSWHYGIWKEGLWSQKDNISNCIDPNRCYSAPPKLPPDYSVDYNQTIEAPNEVNVTLNYTCKKQCKFSLYLLVFLK